MNYNYYKNIIARTNGQRTKLYYTDTNGKRMNLEIAMVRTDKKGK